MQSGRGGFTIRGDESYIRESLAIEAGLARALDDGPEEPFEETLYADAESVHQRAERESLREGPEAARQLMLHEVRRYTRWLRAVDLGLAGNDDTDDATFAEGMRGNLAQVALSAALYGLRAGMPPEHLINEVVAAGALELGEAGQVATGQLLARCYDLQQRPDLALSVLVRSPMGDSAALHLRSVLDTARRAYALGHVRRVAELLDLTDWRTDPTGLERELLRRLVDEQEPTEAELAARVDARGRAFAAGDWAGLRELALSDVMWLEEDVNLWRALAAILRMYGAGEQADLAGEVAQLVDLPGDGW
ncbi:hypothetical protein [Streptomyces sporangiiformans]|uniref:Uncharacterized protein n=1 Tax=Streptomyces sporangiiformans TaxID=2315329 RepID=A0A505D2N2_9ACTN|nr:hypothetical protein [Streptomyces sporangiiformans]TPQ17954.1 hypothetical protein FGD71_033605 [Streptomyces sporangiiformans]